MKIFTAENCENLEDAFEKHPGYIPIYLNIKKEKNITKLKLTKNKGEILYAIYENDVEDIYEPLKETIKEVEISKRTVIEPKKSIKKINEEKNVEVAKKGKQSRLFDFIKKK